MEPVEVRTEDDGVLRFDGRVIEYFEPRLRNTWRIHVAHVVDWEVEPRKGMSRVKVMLAKGSFQNVLIEDADLPNFEQLRAAVDAVRR